MDDSHFAAELEKRLKELAWPGGGAPIDSDAGKKAQTVFTMLYAIRQREQVAVSQKLSRYTLFMAVFVALATVAQAVTVWLAYSRPPS